MLSKVAIILSRPWTGHLMQFKKKITEQKSAERVLSHYFLVLKNTLSDSGHCVKKSDLEIETKTNFGSFLRPSKIWSHIVVLSMYTSINPFLPHPELKVIRHTYIDTVGRNTI